jgi:hypothetical protein
MKVPDALEDVDLGDVVDDSGSDDLDGELGEVEELEVGDETDGEVPSYLDPETVGSHLVRIKVDGEEIEVPLSEALAGYSRQSKFTKEMQGLAAQREQIKLGAAIEAALRTDPATAIAALQARYLREDTPSFEDPLEAQVYEIKQVLARQQADAQTNAIASEVSTLQSRFGEDFDFDACTQLVLSGEAKTLTAAHKLVAFDKFVGSGQAEEVARKAAADAKRTAAKRGQATTSRGTGRGAVKEKAPEHETFREALVAAFRAEGVEVD